MPSTRPRLATLTVPYMTQRRRVWYARLQVPEVLRALLGRSVLIRTTGHQDLAQAMPVARRIIEEWREDIAKAQGLKATLMAERAGRYMLPTMRPTPAPQPVLKAGGQGLSSSKATTATVEAWARALRL